ncbi:unnamed protein product [Cochlearia groenlandica]
MQMMAEQAAASRTATGFGSASGFGTASVSTTHPVHVGTPTPVHVGTPTPVHVGSTPPPVHAGTCTDFHTGTPPPPHVPATPNGTPDRDVQGPVHPELDVPGHVPYATFQVEDILAQPGHDGMRRLDPHKSANTYW